MTSLTFERLRAANVARCEKQHPLDEWSETDWATALAGECGETCNLIKKRRRGDDVPLQRVAEEIADTLLYLDLLAARLGIDLETAVRHKFAADGARTGDDVEL